MYIIHNKYVTVLLRNKSVKTIVNSDHRKLVIVGYISDFLGAASHLLLSFGYTAPCIAERS